MNYQIQRQKDFLIDYIDRYIGKSIVTNRQMIKLQAVPNFLPDRPMRVTTTDRASILGQPLLGDELSITKSLVLVFGSIIMVNLIVAIIITDIEWLNQMSKVRSLNRIQGVSCLRWEFIKEKRNKTRSRPRKRPRK